MKKVLFVNACVRPNSRTCILAQRVLEKIGGEVEELNLETTQIPPLDWEMLQERDEHTKNNDFSSPMFDLARQFISADEIVIAAPYWELGFPSSLRLYIEAISVTGLSFIFTPEGSYQGLSKAKRLIYVTTAGGTIGSYDFGFAHIKALAEVFYKIPEIVQYKAENLDIKGNDIDAILGEVLSQIDSDLS